MKKALSLLLAAVALISLLSLTSCSRADIDLRNKDNIYSDLESMIKNSADYAGQTVALSAECVAIYNFSTNKIARYSVHAIDENGENHAFYEMRTKDGKYPKTGSQATIFGVLNKDIYVDVSKIRDAEYSMDFDLDALAYTPEQLATFISNYNTQYQSSAYYGKTIRIFGHLKTVDEGYTFLVGLDGNGQYLWDIELRDENGAFEYPNAEGNTVNPVEVIGTLSTYTSKNVIYTCITVKEIGRAESVFKEETITQ